MNPHWIFLSPHLDDAVFSCGGLIYDLVERGATVSIWTICAGDPPDVPLPEFAQSLHDRWQTGPEAVAARRAEDKAACSILGASFEHFGLPDCIYRRDPDTGEALYNAEWAIFGPLAPQEEGALSGVLAQQWAGRLPAGGEVVAPLGIGGHVDHKLVRRAAEDLARPVRYYPDLPYVFGMASQVPDLLPPGSITESFRISDGGITAWTRAMAAYESQVSTFWESEAQMAERVRSYIGEYEGLNLWTPTY